MKIKRSTLDQLNLIRAQWKMKGVVNKNLTYDETVNKLATDELKKANKKANKQ